MSSQARGILAIITGTVLVAFLVYVKLEKDTLDNLLTIIAVGVIALLVHEGLEDLP